MNWEDHFDSPKPKVKLVTVFDLLRQLFENDSGRLNLKGIDDKSVSLNIQEAIQLLKSLSTDSGFHEAVAAARTCYSSQLVTTSDSMLEIDKDLAQKIADSTWDAGHLTPYMHRNFTFLMDNVSRQALWCFFHSHPFYNSEQVSQRYRRVSKENVIMPKLTGTAKKIFNEAIDFAYQRYDMFRGDLLFEIAKKEFDKRAPDFLKGEKGPVLKKTQEAARYVVPIGTHAHLYHSVNTVTLARYWAAVNSSSVPTEVYYIVKAMVEEVAKTDPSLVKLFKDPLSRDEFLEEKVKNHLSKNPVDTTLWAEEFDRDLGEGRQSRLVDCKPDGLKQMASAIRDILGLPSSSLSDVGAIRLVTDPNFNKRMGDVLTLDHITALARSQYMLSFTFMTKLSHTADSQEQRQRMMPSARPLLEHVVSSTPDYITPALITAAGEKAVELYQETMALLWNYRNQLLELNVPEEMANYLLPNGLALRFRETVDLLNFRQKDVKRECLNAQEEIGRITVQQRSDIVNAFPELEDLFGPPCYHRFATGVKPYCPEGDRYCLVSVWKGKGGDDKFKIENLMQSRII